MKMVGGVCGKITANGQVYEPCGLTHGQSNEVQSNN
jgi:hypothetical protein